MTTKRRISTGHGSKLPRLRERAIAALLTALSIADAAKTIGVQEKTLRGWMNDPTFDRAFRTARRQIFERAVSGVTAAAAHAVHTLLDVAADKRASAAARVSASTGILRFAFDVVHHEQIIEQNAELAARIAELERNLKITGGAAHATLSLAR